MFVKVHHAYRDIIAICDEDLIGMVFEEANNMLDIKESFFKGESKTEDEVSEIMQNGMKEDCVFNIVGKESVNLALEQGIITKDSIKKVKGIPFSLILL